MRCKICKNEYHYGCLCGYCWDCIGYRTHEGCGEIEKERLDKKEETGK